jgi:hypothetical protein
VTNIDLTLPVEFTREVDPESRNRIVFLVTLIESITTISFPEGSTIVKELLSLNVTLVMSYPCRTGTIVGWYVSKLTLRFSRYYIISIKR